MKYLIVVLVVGLVLWLLLRGRSGGKSGSGDGAGRRGVGPVQMVACARCGVHLPRHDALVDGQGRLFCGGEHRDAGPL